jgi:hypothetical protein
VLSTGFLDGSHPIVDAYELGVRLQHMLRRLTALAAGAMVQAPICVLPGLWLGNAVAADSHHLLQYLGVTHVVNAAQVGSDTLVVVGACLMHGWTALQFHVLLLSLVAPCCCAAACVSYNRSCSVRKVLGCCK